MREIIYLVQRDTCVVINKKNGRFVLLVKDRAGFRWEKTGKLLTTLLRAAKRDLIKYNLKKTLEGINEK